MGKLGSYSYPDIRFGDAVELAARILGKFRGVVNVKGLAWELGMAENSGALFAKVAALRDFGLVDGRGELRVTPLAQRILHPATPEEGREARAQAFQRVELLRQLWERFQGEAPDYASVLVGVEEITRAPRDEIVRRATLIQKHLADGSRVLPPLTGQAPPPEEAEAPSLIVGAAVPAPVPPRLREPAVGGALYLSAGSAQLLAPLTPEYVEIAIALLRALKAELEVVPAVRERWSEGPEAEAAPTGTEEFPLGEGMPVQGDLPGSETVEG